MRTRLATFAQGRGSEGDALVSISTAHPNDMSSYKVKSQITLYENERGIHMVGSGNRDQTSIWAVTQAVCSAETQTMIIVVIELVKKAA